MITIKQILDQKGRECYSVNSSINVFKALEIMADKHIGILLVRNDLGNPIGMFSERDFVRKTVTFKETVLSRCVEEFMSHSLLGIGIEKTIQDAMEIISEKHIRHLLVCENKNVAGIISITDIINALIREQNATIKSLNDYIYGTTYW